MRCVPALTAVCLADRTVGPVPGPGLRSYGRRIRFRLRERPQTVNLGVAGRVKTAGCSVGLQRVVLDTGRCGECPMLLLARDIGLGRCYVAVASVREDTHLTYRRIVSYLSRHRPRLLPSKHPSERCEPEASLCRLYPPPRPRVRRGEVNRTCGRCSYMRRRTPSAILVALTRGV